METGLTVLLIASYPFDAWGLSEICQIVVKRVAKANDAEAMFMWRPATPESEDMASGEKLWNDETDRRAVHTRKGSDQRRERQGAVGEPGEYVY
jgi:hypothetical protein